MTEINSQRRNSATPKELPTPKESPDKGLYSGGETQRHCRASRLPSRGRRRARDSPCRRDRGRRAGRPDVLHQPEIRARAAADGGVRRDPRRPRGSGALCDAADTASVRGVCESGRALRRRLAAARRCRRPGRGRRRRSIAPDAPVGLFAVIGEGARDRRAHDRSRPCRHRPLTRASARTACHPRARSRCASGSRSATASSSQDGAVVGSDGFGFAGCPTAPTTRSRRSATSSSRTTPALAPTRRSIRPAVGATRIQPGRRSTTSSAMRTA